MSNLAKIKDVVTRGADLTGAPPATHLRVCCGVKCNGDDVAREKYQRLVESATYIDVVRSIGDLAGGKVTVSDEHVERGRNDNRLIPMSISYMDLDCRRISRMRRSGHRVLVGLKRQS